MSAAVLPGSIQVSHAVNLVTISVSQHEFTQWHWQLIERERFSTTQTSPGGHDDARSDRYDPATWRESTGNSGGAHKPSSTRVPKAIWHGKLSVVADTQRFLEQLQRRQQAS